MSVNSLARRGISLDLFGVFLGVFRHQQTPAYKCELLCAGVLAEREGFEPSVRGKPVQRISNPSPSATRPPLRELRCNRGSGTCQTASTGGFLRLWSLGVPIKRQIFCPGLFNETTLNEPHGISRIKSTRSLSKTQPGVCQRRVESCRTNVPSPSYPS